MTPQESKYLKKYEREGGKKVIGEFKFKKWVEFKQITCLNWSYPYRYIYLEFHVGDKDESVGVQRITRRWYRPIEKTAEWLMNSVFYRSNDDFRTWRAPFISFLMKVVGRW